MKGEEKREKKKRNQTDWIFAFEGFLSEEEKERDRGLIQGFID